jgi:hypothetical protein
MLRRGQFAVPNVARGAQGTIPAANKRCHADGRRGAKGAEARKHPPHRPAPRAAMMRSVTTARLSSSGSRHHPALSLWAKSRRGGAEGSPGWPARRAEAIRSVYSIIDGDKRYWRVRRSYGPSVHRVAVHTRGIPRHPFDSGFALAQGKLFGACGASPARNDSIPWCPIALYAIRVMRGRTRRPERYRFIRSRYQGMWVPFVAAMERWRGKRKPRPAHGRGFRDHRSARGA